MFSSMKFGRSSRALVLGGLAFTVALIVVVPGGANAAKPGNSPNAKACQKGQWETDWVRADGTEFNSEQECVAYAAQGGVLFTPAQAACNAELEASGLSTPASPNYVLGTSGNDDFSSQLTAGNDVVCGFAGDDHIESLSGDDIFLGGDGGDSVGSMSGGSFLGGTGNDFVLKMSGGTFNGGADHDQVGGSRDSGFTGGTFNGGDGDDFVAVTMQGGTFNGGAGTDGVGFPGIPGTGLSGGTFNGGDGDDSVGDMSDGTFNGGDGNDRVTTLSGGTFSGESGCDSVVSNLGGTFDPGDETGCPA